MAGFCTAKTTARMAISNARINKKVVIDRFSVCGQQVYRERDLSPSWRELYNNLSRDGIELRVILKYSSEWINLVLNY
jgi:hypothetical protein